jgi:hypothetical protein
MENWYGDALISRDAEAEVVGEWRTDEEIDGNIGKTARTT